MFVDGCYWHGCPLHFTLPRVNSDWWREKIDATITRDADQTLRLEQAGWLVLRYWEHQVQDELDLVVSEIEAAVRASDGALAETPG